MSETVDPPKSFLQKLLDGIEIVENEVSHPAVIFLITCVLVIVLSYIFYLPGVAVTYEVVDSATHE